MKDVKEFPDNLFEDLGVEAPSELADDFTATFMYVMYDVASPRDVKLMLMRYRKGMTFEEIAKEMEITRQRACAIVQEVTARINGIHIDMLKKGIRKYMDDLLIERVNSLRDIVAVSERESIRAEAYALGVHDGESKASPTVSDAFDDIPIDTLGMSPRLYNSCRRNHVKNLANLLKVGDGVIDFRTFGKNCFHELCDLLKGMCIDPSLYFPRAIEKFGMGD